MTEAKVRCETCYWWEHSFDDPKLGACCYDREQIIMCDDDRCRHHSAIEPVMIPDPLLHYHGTNWLRVERGQCAVCGKDVSKP